MIYTITLNPALDYTMEVPVLFAGQVCRSKSESMSIGGKGINVSVLLARLGVSSKALGIAAGKTGALLCEYLRQYGIDEGFMRVESGETRINVKLRHGNVTEINGSGPYLSAADTERFVNMLKLTAGDYVLLAGNEPQSESGCIYDSIMTAAAHKGAEIILDTSGKAFEKLLNFRPFLIKPNADETAEVLGDKPETHNEAVKSALKFQNLGARNVLISLGEKGSVLLTEDGKVHKQKAPPGVAVNTVGAGDSMLAGFLAEYIRSADYKKALLFATAAGSATAFSEGIAERDDVLRVFELLYQSANKSN